MHARRSFIAKRLTHAAVPHLAAVMREDDNVKRYESEPEFHDTLLAWWRSRSLLDNLLALVLPVDTLRTLDRRMKIDRVYQCALEEEFRDMTAESTDRDMFLALTDNTRNEGAVQLAPRLRRLL